MVFVSYYICEVILEPVTAAIMSVSVKEPHSVSRMCPMFAFFKVKTWIEWKVWQLKKSKVMCFVRKQDSDRISKEIRSCALSTRGTKFGKKSVFLDCWLKWCWIWCTHWYTAKNVTCFSSAGGNTTGYKCFNNLLICYIFSSQQFQSQILSLVIPRHGVHFTNQDL